MTGVRGFLLILIIAIGVLTPSPNSLRDDPEALWVVVHDLCGVDMIVSGRPAPCLAVDRSRGFAVVPDPTAPTQVLLVPTRRISGIESPELLTPGTPNYFELAWRARVYLERRARQPIPRDKVALAINSRFGRTQEQLHIHIDCVRPVVRATLIDQQAILTGYWRRFPGKLVGRRYRVMRLDGADLAGRDPFKLLARGDAAARADMLGQTLVVVGTNFAGRPGFVLLAGQGGVPDNPKGAGEDLLDHTCAVLRSP